MGRLRYSSEIPVGGEGGVATHTNSFTRSTSTSPSTCMPRATRRPAPLTTPQIPRQPTLHPWRSFTPRI